MAAKMAAAAFRRGKSSIFEDHSQLEAHNFEMDQYLDKRISDFSSRINALQNGTKLGAVIPKGFSAT